MTVRIKDMISRLLTSEKQSVLKKPETIIISDKEQRTKV